MEESNIHESLVIPVDYEKQAYLDNKQVNPYVLAVATARYARDLNDRVRKFFGPETNVQPRNITMKKLEEGKTTIAFEEDQEEPESEPTPRKK
jgi:DNA-directed RNA polymerase subunit K/omega